MVSRIRVRGPERNLNISDLYFFAGAFDGSETFMDLTPFLLSSFLIDRGRGLFFGPKGLLRRGIRKRPMNERLHNNPIGKM